LTKTSVQAGTWREVRRRVLEGISDATRQKGHITNLLHFVLEEIEKSVAFTWAAIWLFDRETETWYIAVSRGLSQDAAEVRFPRGSALPCLVGERGTPMLIDNLETENFYRICPEHFRMRSALYSPMWISNKPVGVIALYSDRSAAFNKEDLSFLETIGHHLGVTITFAALEEQRARLAILEERDRLARNLHDGMLQILSSIKLLVAGALESLAFDDPGDTGEILGTLERTLEEANHDVRQSVARLMQSEGFESVYDVAGRTKHRLECAGIETRIDLEAMQLPGHISDLLASICRESANNILKHSHAKHACINLTGRGSHVELIVSDDGVGLPDVLPPDGEVHLGIQMMKERAAQSGGIFVIEDRGREGLRLRCKVRVHE
jgi:signal transduction histidine kinase